MNFKNTLVLASLLTLSFGAYAKKETKKSATSAQSYKADLTESSIKWEGKKVTGSHNGKIKVSKGLIELKGEELSAASFDVDMSSMSCDDISDPKKNSDFLGHMKSADFFEVEKFPIASFVVKKVEKATVEKIGDQAATHILTGDLTIKGKTNEFKAPAIISKEGNTIKAKSNWVIDRTKWGIIYGSGNFIKGIGDKAINDEFTLAIELIAKK